VEVGFDRILPGRPDPPLLDELPAKPASANGTKPISYDWIARMLPDGFMVRQESPLTFADSEPEPDIAVVKGTGRSDELWGRTTTGLLDRCICLLTTVGSAGSVSP
jgi:hypothetical protein